ncbi:fused MFS/spermidine synthase [Corallococcus sp. M34]|uniref:spermidine synthase n=1 Tax=Citreicoccus inhibens TaxID=2849499 RepID=UPI001C2438D6|nr:fused MFS/spermidine synthase [Citreicoccus inhibens]MBU8895592.1 fused MFS/spermidine synthase [Citreicoccus inhibens]
MARYAVAIFTSAFLLFGVQPLVGRYALPWYGGTSGVWTTCMLFFQTALLAGYGYAHVVSSRLRPRAQVRLHLGVLAIAVAALGVRALLTGSTLAPGPEWRPLDEHAPVLRLLGMLTWMVGLPFVVLGATGPLLQSWFASARPGRSPYVLYALSNAGSLLSLLGYPFLIEPWVSRGAQTWAWSAGFLCFGFACVACARDVLARAGESSPAVDASAPVEEGRRPGLGLTLKWLGLSGCASVLLLATTNQLSQDVAAGPFLWVLPLAVYLLTFILAFARESTAERPRTALLLIGSVALVAYAHKQGPNIGLLWQVLFYAAALYAGAMVCHGALYRLRPAPRHLGAFYLWVSTGGVLGGVFVNLLAPVLFRVYWEYPLALAACCAITMAGMLRRPSQESLLARLQRVLRGAMLVTVSLNMALITAGEQSRVRYSERGFFGVVQVLEQVPSVPSQHQFTLRHGITTHGWQFVDPSKRKKATSYFTEDSGLGLAIAEQRRLRQAVGLPAGLRVGVLGLGVGTSAALLEPEDSLCFYEINPTIIALARGQQGFFSYLLDARGAVEVVEGDARISLERELERGQPRGFDVLALDVFSSDAIPVHLLTEEAVALYLRHLAPHGVLALHISNQYLDLLPVTLAHARASGLFATLVYQESRADALRSTWVVLSPDREFSWGPTFTRTLSSVRRLSLRGPPDFTWTDERSSVLLALRSVVWERLAEPEPPPARAEPAGP